MDYEAIRGDEIDVRTLTLVMNDTKWDELRLAMYEMTECPAFRCKDSNGYYSSPDREWFYHFRIGGYLSIIYTDIIVDNSDQREEVRLRVKAIHLPGEETTEGFRIYGYARPGQSLEYI